MGDTAFTNTIKPESGKTVTVEGDLGVTGAFLLPPGLIFPYAGQTVPKGYLLCDGRAISRTTYANLFAAIGVSWGAGNNTTTFNIPDLRGAFLRGSGSHGSETKADGTPFVGKNLGSYENDAMQRITGQWGGSNGGSISSANGVYTLQGTGFPDTYSKINAQNDGVNFDNSTSTSPNPARTDDAETRPFNASVNYIIKV